MKTKNALPAYMLAQNKPRSWYHQLTGYGYIIGRHRTRHARPRPWPDGSGDTTGLEHPAAANRAWHTFIFKAWKLVVAGGGKPAWDAAAAALPIQNNKGNLKSPNAFQLFVWYNSYLPAIAWNPPSTFNPAIATYLATPPDHTIARTLATTPTRTYHSPPWFGIRFDDPDDLSNYVAWLQITRAKLSATGKAASQWHRLPYSIITPYTPAPWVDYFTGSNPVPPWTATPTYVEADWPEADNLLSPVPTGTNQTIRAGVQTKTLLARCYIRKNTYGVQGPILSWGINPATGARFALWTANDDQTISLATYTSWTGTPTLSHTHVDTYWPTGNFTLVEVYLTGTTTTFVIGTPVYGAFATGTPYNGDIGIESLNEAYDFNAYRCTLSPNGWTATYDYQAILENPAQPGPRGARLTLAPSTPPAPHSLWLPFDLDLA